MNAVAPIPSGNPQTPGAGPTKTPIAAATPASPGAFRFMPLKAEERTQYLKMLVYGPPGVGKSTLAGSATNIEAMKDVLLVTAEGGDVVFDSNTRVADPDNITMLRMERIEQLVKVFEFLKVHIAARDRGDIATLKNLQRMTFGIPPEVEIADADVKQFRTVILDSLTDIEDLNMRKILGIDGFVVGDDFEAPQFKEFRLNNNIIQAIVRSFRNLNVNLIVICGHKWSENELKIKHYTPWLTGQLATQIQSFVDLVGYLVVSAADTTKPDLRRLYIQPQAGIKFDAKCRRANIKKHYYDDPEMEHIMRDFGFIR